MGPAAPQGTSAAMKTALVPRLLASVVCAMHMLDRASGACESHCRYPCIELNGPLNLECGDCNDADGYICYPGAPDFATWPDRNTQAREASMGGKPVQVAMGSSGTQHMINTDDPDAPIELTEKSMVMRDKFYAIATPKRKREDFEKFREAPALAEFLDSEQPVPAESPRNCEVHSCVLIDGDEPCAEGRADCQQPRGHLQSFGEQMDLIAIDEYDAADVDAPAFWRDYVSKYKPVVIRGGAAAVTDLDRWSDEALLAPRETGAGAGYPRCALQDGRKWYVTVEKNNRISHNDRLPLMDGWDFCKFLHAYRQPDAPTYCIHSITGDKLVGLTTELGLPGILACNDLYRAMHAVRMWMSRGNTTSSQHFDTHDNLMLQIDGTKDIYLSHPNESAAMYMDHHDKYAPAA